MAVEWKNVRGYTPVPVHSICLKSFRRIEYHSLFYFYRYGELQGLNKQETAERYGKEQVYEWRRSYDSPPPKGESLEMCSQRAVAYFKDFVRVLIFLFLNVKSFLFDLYDFDILLGIKTFKLRRELTLRSMHCRLNPNWNQESTWWLLLMGTHWGLL